MQKTIPPANTAIDPLESQASRNAIELPHITPVGDRPELFALPFTDLIDLAAQNREDEFIG